MSERLRETLRSKTGDKEFTYLNLYSCFFFFFLSCVHVRMQDDDCGKLFKRGKFKKWVARPASACHGTEEPNTKL